MMRRLHILRSFGLVFSLLLFGACSPGADISEVREVVGDAPVVLLSTSSCGYCRKLRNDLAGWGVDYVDIDVESKREGRRAYDLVNGRGVPILLIGDSILHGYSPERSRDLLVAANLVSDSSSP